MRSIVLIALLLAGCAEATPLAPGPKLVGPASWAMAKNKPLPDIPKDEGENRKARAAYYTESREVTAQCFRRSDALQDWVLVVLR